MATRNITLYTLACELRPTIKPSKTDIGIVNRAICVTSSLLKLFGLRFFFFFFCIPAKSRRVRTFNNRTRLRAPNDFDVCRVQSEPNDTNYVLSDPMQTPFVHFCGIRYVQWSAAAGICITELNALNGCT